MNDRIQEIRKRVSTDFELYPDLVGTSIHYKDRAYLLSEYDRLTRYLERIEVTFGEFECHRLAREALSHLKG